MNSSSHPWTWTARLHHAFPEVTQLNLSRQACLTAGDLAGIALMPNLTTLQLPEMAADAAAGFAELGLMPLLTSLEVRSLAQGATQHLHKLGTTLKKLQVVHRLPQGDTDSLFSGVSKLHGLRTLDLSTAEKTTLGVAQVRQLAQGCTNLLVRSGMCALCEHSHAPTSSICSPMRFHSMLAQQARAPNTEQPSIGLTSPHLISDSSPGSIPLLTPGPGRFPVPGQHAIPHSAGERAGHTTAM